MKFLCLKSDHVKTSHGGNKLLKGGTRGVCFKETLERCGNVVIIQWGQEEVIGKQRGYNKVYIVVFSSWSWEPDCVHVQLHVNCVAPLTSPSYLAELRDFEPDDQQEIEVDEGNTAVIECHLPESQPKAQVRYSVKQEWLETSKGTDRPSGSTSSGSHVTSPLAPSSPMTLMPSSLFTGKV